MLIIVGLRRKNAPMIIKIIPIIFDLFMLIFMLYAPNILILYSSKNLNLFINLINICFSRLLF